jgi:hypothetical protein
MKRNYAVKTRFVFSGVFYVKAGSKAEAKEYVEKHCGLVIGGDIHSTLSDEDVNWDFPVHPDKVVGRTALSRVKGTNYDDD